LVLSVLGGFSARRGGHAIEWGRPAPARLVRYLLARPGRSATADDLFAVFWPRAEAAVARRNLHVTVSRARAVVALPGMTNAVLESAENVYRLSLNPWDVVDADDFTIAARAALTASTGDRLPRLQHAAGLWTGEPLSEDRYEDWASQWRDTLIDLYRTVLRVLKAEHERLENTTGVLDTSRRLVSLDPLDERAQQDLIVALAREGLRSQGLRQFLEFRRALVSQLGIEPSEESSRLHARLLAGEAI
jgi:DNA-binding SARP family transcriptional activator